MATTLDGGSGFQLPQATGVKVTPTNWGQIESVSMKTIDAMNKLTEGMLKPVVDRMEKEQYYQGMAKVAQGQSLKEVEEQEPWYMKIVGPSATVRGAQTMTATTAIQTAETDFLQAMPDLRKQSPDEVRKYLVGKATDMKSTGDPLVDATIQAKIAEGWGPMLKTHMREHLAWQQEDMKSKYTTSNIAVGNTMRTARENSSTGIGEDDLRMASESAVEAARPLPGQSDDSWQTSIADTMDATLHAGNFDHYNAIRNSDLWAKINPKLRERLEAALPQYREKYERSSPVVTNILTDAQAFEHNVSSGQSNIQTPEELFKHMDEINALAQQRTGASAPHYDNKAKQRVYEQWLDARDRNAAMRERLAATETAKAQKYNDGKTLWLQAYNGSNPDMPGWLVGEDVQRDTGNGLYQSELVEGTPEQQNMFLAKIAQVAGNPKLRVPVLESKWKMAANGLITGAGPVTESQMAAYDQMKRMLGAGQGQGVAALGSYIGKENAATIMGMIEHGIDPMNKEQINDYRRLIQEGGSPETSKKDREDVAAVVGSMDPSIWKKYIPVLGGPGQLTNFAISDSAKRDLSAAIADSASLMAKTKHITLERATYLAANDALASTDFLAGTLVFRKANVPNGSLSEAVGRLTNGKYSQTQSNYQESARGLINDMLTDRVKAAGGDMKNFDPTKYEIADGVQKGNGVVTFSAYPKDPSLGRRYTFTIHPQQLVDRIKADDMARSTRAKQDMKYSPATNLTLPADGYMGD